MENPTLTASGRAVATRLNSPSGLLVLLGAAHGVTHAYGGLMPLIFPTVAREFNLSYTDIGFLVGFTTFAGGMVQLIYGPLQRRFLRKSLLAAAQFIVGVSCLITGLASGFVSLFLGNLGARLGSSAQHPVGNSILTERFPASKRGTVMSLHVVGGNIGTVLVPILGALLLSSVGWRWTLFALAVPAFLLSFTLAGFVEEHKQQPSTEHAATAPSGTLVREIFSNRTIRLIMLASVIGAAGRGLGALNTYLTLYLDRNLGLPANTINILYACLLLGGVIGPFALGRLSDQAGRRTALYLTYAGATTLILLFVGAGAAAPGLLGALLFTQGVFSHSDSSILTAYLADATTVEQRDVAFSIFFTVAFGIGALWPTALGYVADHYGLIAAFIAMGVTYALAGACLLPIRDKKTIS